MRNTIVTLSILLISLSFFFACGGADTMIKGESYEKREGWIDENTYQVVAIGLPMEGIDSEMQKRSTARDAAIIKAQSRVIEKFVGAEITGKAATENSRLLGEVIKKEFSGVIRSGDVVKETYNEQGECEIFYRVTGKDLKKNVEAKVSQSVTGSN